MSQRVISGTPDRAFSGYPYSGGASCTPPPPMRAFPLPGFADGGIFPPGTVVTPEHVWIMQQLAEKDQLIGRMKFECEEMQRCLAEKEDYNEQIQMQVSVAQQDVRHLKLDLEFRQQKLEDYAKRSQELEDTNRRLFSELEYKSQELKHVSLDLGAAVANANAQGGSKSSSPRGTAWAPASLGSSYGTPLSGSIALALRSSPGGWVGGPA